MAAARRSTLIFAAIAAALGAAGVAAAAAAAHTDGGGLLATASQMLTVHAAAGLALAALCEATGGPSALVALAIALQTGVALFAADLAARRLFGERLFPFAAPIGGSLTILCWVALSLWAAAALRKPPRNTASAREEIGRDQ